MLFWEMTPCGNGSLKILLWKSPMLVNFSQAATRGC